MAVLLAPNNFTKQAGGLLSDHFVDLNRRFKSYLPSADTEAAAMRSYVMAMGDGEIGSSWDEILKHRLVVILGEPGSGKSEEFRHQAEARWSLGQFTFFLELNRLVAEDFDMVLGEQRITEFRRWESSQSEAIFFLDAVDESKLVRVDDFLVALERVHGATFQRLHRCRFVISSRISAWRPETDRAEVVHRFGLPSATTVTNSDEGQKEPISVVILEPLDRKRVEIFVQKRGIVDPAAFIAEIDQHNAWDFARRPYDVIELHRFWLGNGRLGALTELMEFSCRQLTKESERLERHDPLSTEQIDEGVETLAAASILCRQLNIRVDDDRSIDAESALNVRDVLPASWKADAQKAVLNRALFDSAHYGMLRFHHRRHAEFLAAKWLAHLLANNCPYEEIEDILFAEIEGQATIRPSLEPVAAWLVGRNDVPSIDRLRLRLLKFAPDIHLRYGDPAALSLDYRRSILKELVERYKGREHISIPWNGDILRRIATPELSGDVSNYLVSAEIPEDLKLDFLMLVGLGRLSDCCSVALAFLCDDKVSENIWLYAAIAIRDAGTPEIRRQAYEKLIMMANPTSRLIGYVVEATFPDVISASELFDLLRKAPEIRHNSVDLPYVLRKHFEHGLTTDASIPVLQGAIQLLREPPLIEHRLVSKRYAWIVELVPLCLHSILSKHSVPEAVGDIVVDAVGLLESRNLHGWWDQPLRGDIEDQLAANLDKHANVKRAIYRRRVEHHRERYGGNPAIHSLNGTYEIAKFSENDIGWMKDDVAAGLMPFADRQLMLEHMLALATRNGSFGRVFRNNLLPAIGADLHLWLFVAKWKVAQAYWPIKWWVLRQKDNGIGDRYWWGRKIRLLKRKWLFLQDWYWIRHHLVALKQGEHAYTLAQIVMDSRRSITNRDEVDWRALESKWGRVIGQTIRSGCESIWRLHSPIYPHEQPDNSVEWFVLAGLPGLESLWQRGALDFVTMSSKEVELATRYACRELNGFPEWFPQLLARRPRETGAALMQAIAGEWNYPAERQHVHGVFSTLVWYDIDPQIVLPGVAQLLAKGNPVNPKILAHALGLMSKHESGWSSLAALAPSRELTSSPGSEVWFLWTAVWMRIDGVSAVHALAQRIGGLEFEAAKALVVGICSNLLNRREGLPSGIAPLTSFREVPCLRILIPIVVRHIKEEEDRDHSNGEAYSPTARDDAERFRHLLWEGLRDSDDFEADAVLREFLSDPLMTGYRDRILELLDRRRSRRADDVPWRAKDVRAFADKHLIPPRSDYTLYRLICRHLKDIQGYYERSEIPDVRNRLREGDLEVALRNLLHEELKKRAGDWYSVTAESEVDLGERPDLTISRPGLNSLPIEVKLANLKHWPLHKLLERLENQLVGQYLRAERVRFGVYVLGNTDPDRRWEDIGGTTLIDFQAVVQRITDRAKEIESEFRQGIDGIAVVGIDFSNPRKRK